MIPVVSRLHTILDNIDLVICDIWGVMHDGLSLHRMAEQALLTARAKGVQTVFLSNAPRPRAFVADHLRTMGLNEQLLDFLVTSGGLARDEVRRHHDGQRLYHLGPSEDHNTIEDLNIIQVDKPEDADVILATDRDFSEIERHRAWLRPAAEKGVPFLCANPDRVVHVGHHLVPCAGQVADLYVELGGKAIFYGKPEPESYLACLDTVGLPRSHEPKSILMIGDSARTDITGANALGFQSVLITGGIHRDGFAGQLGTQTEALPTEVVAKLMRPHKAMPTYLMRALA